MCGVVKPLRVEGGLMRSVYWCEPGMDGPAMTIGVAGVRSGRWPATG
jgi:hypothetical protein